jgi:hypothetical protein
MRQALLLVTAVLAVLASSAPARAADPDACGGAFDQSQVRRDEGHLLEARRLLRVCSDPGCSPTQRKLCSSWLSEVEALLADGTKAEASVVAVERSKAVVVSATLETQSVPAATPPGSAQTPHTPPTVARWGPLRTTGVVLGVAGIASLIVGGAFGADAFAMKAARCSNGVCDSGSTSTIYGAGAVSSVGLVTGSVLVAGGVSLFAVGAGGRSGVTAAMLPSMGSSGGGLHIVGSW